MENFHSLTIATIGLIGLSTVPSLWALGKAWRHPLRSTNEHRLYSDKDGQATSESMSSYSTVPYFRIILVALGVGIGCAFALAVFATAKGHVILSERSIAQLWILFVSWMFILIQVLATIQETSTVTRTTKGIINSVSCIFLGGLCVCFVYGLQAHQKNSPVVTTLVGLQLASSIIITLTFAAIPRRPDVFRLNGNIVDRQNTRSLWARWSLSWCLEILDLSATKLLDVSDLPNMDASVRAEDAKEAFKAIALKPAMPLWIQIFWAYRWRFMFQWVLTVFSAVVDALPHLAVLRLLQYLEAREGTNNAGDMEAWLWVFSLLLATLLETLTDARIGWLMWSDLAIPIRVTLTSLLYEKMLKTKDCKDPPTDKATEHSKVEEPKPYGDSGQDAAATNGSATKGSATNDAVKNASTIIASDVNNGKPAHSSSNQKAGSEKAKEDEPEAQKSVVNMFAVDTSLVGHAAAMSQYYIMFVSKFIVTVVFLLFLIGWESLLAGMVATAIFYPVNKYLVKRYQRFQKALMSIRDQKTALVTEALSGIKQIKFSATEAEWGTKIMDIRQEELDKLWKTKINNLYMTLGSDLTPIFLTVFALATYSLIYGQLLPSIAFTALAVFMQLEGVLSWIPMLAMIGINGKVSMDRIQGYLRGDDKPQTTYPGHHIAFDNVSVTFPSTMQSIDDRFVLRDISLQFPNNALSVVFGPTGSGKSLLLAAILGEVDLIQGSIVVPRPPSEAEFFDEKANADNWIIPSAIAFIAQQPWIENATVKNNILFGLPYDATRYDKVIEACALIRDLNMLEDGDGTEVGAQGITLSGGQKWRLTLARAFYSRAGILILDDVFSALDAHVGREIYEKALMGELSEGRTRILVTHHVSLCLPQAEYAVRLTSRGTLGFSGLVSDLRKTSEMEDILQFENAPSQEDNSEKAPPIETNLEANGAPSTVEEAKKPKKLVEEEKRETGKVKKVVYTAYLTATGGIPFWAFVLMFYIVAQGFVLGKNFWIKLWTSSYEHQNSKLNHMHHEYAIQTNLARPFVDYSARILAGDNEKLGYYLGGYIVLSFVSTLVDVGRYYMVYRGALRASKLVFQDMTYQVLRTPMRWLDTVPTGRILNRFTADFQSFDSALSGNFAQTGASFLSVIGIMVAAFFVSPYIIIFALVLLCVCGQIGLRYIQGARSIKRLTSIQRSPMISHFSSSLQGLSTIRAFSKTMVFEGRMNNLIDAFTSAIWYNYLFSSWVGFRMALVGTVFSFAVASFIVTTPGVDASLGGFALAFALSYRRTVNRLIKFMASTELDMNAAERIFEYTGVEIENQDGMDNLPASWPAEGRLEVNDLEVGYAQGLPSVLKGLSFKAEANHRIGVVGRTGAGKSTLSLALFRFLEARKGSITIDGIDISKIKLHDLRTRLTIIPQDPVLFSGTLRSNLDPFDQFSDYQLKEVLQRVHLVPSADNTPLAEREDNSTPGSDLEGSSSAATAVDATNENVNPFLSLSLPISSGGSNLSQGQKQLLCLARAILTRPKLLLLDEATSAVDMHTDTLIQCSIREEFRNTTLLVVAHRLSTVADFDRILVVDDGRTVDWGSPKQLLEKEGESAFRDMVDRSGEKTLLERIILGGEQELTS